MFTVGTKPSSYTTSGDMVTVPGGQLSKMTVNGSTVCIAGGGAATVSASTATSGINKIITKGGTGSTNGSNGFYTVHWCSNMSTIYNTTLQPCHVWNGHTHDKTGTCPTKEVDVECTANTGQIPCPRCGGGQGVNVNTGETYAMHGTYKATKYDCNQQPRNTQKYSCTNGRIDCSSTASCGTCLGADSQSLTNTGNGYANIQLKECENIRYNNAVVKSPKYVNNTVYLILRDDIVCYFKRW